MYVTRHAVPVTVVHSSCSACGTHVCVTAMGFLSEDRIEQIRIITPLCSKCFIPFARATDDEQNPWQDEFSVMEGLENAAH